jgi:hypothetical protein
LDSHLVDVLVVELEGSGLQGGKGVDAIADGDVVAAVGREDGGNEADFLLDLHLLNFILKITYFLLFL